MNYENIQNCFLICYESEINSDLYYVSSPISNDVWMDFLKNVPLYAKFWREIFYQNVPAQQQKSDF